MVKPDKTNDKTAIALINNNLGYIVSDISEIKTAIKDLNSIFATKEQLAETATVVENRLISLESSSKFWKVASPTIAAIAGSFVTFLLINYLQSL